MTIKKYGAGGKPTVVEGDLSDEEVEDEEGPEDDDRDDERDEPVAAEPR